MSENTTNIIALKSELDILLDDINISNSETEFLKLTEMYCLNFIDMKHNDQNEDMYNIERNVSLNKIYKIAKNKNYEGIDKKIIWDIYQKAFREVKCTEMDNKTDIQVVNKDGVKISFKFDLDMRELLAYDKNGDLSATDKGIELISNKFIDIFGIRSGRKSVDAFIPDEGIWTTTTSEWLPHVVSKTLIQKTNTIFV